MNKILNSICVLALVSLLSLNALANESQNTSKFSVSTQNLTNNDSGNKADNITAVKPVNQFEKNVANEFSAHVPEDLTVWQMFLSAGLVVKIVMIILVLLSILTWAIALNKYLQLSKDRKSVKQELKIIKQYDDFESALSGTKNLKYVNYLLNIAQKEISLSTSRSNHNDIKQRIADNFTNFIAARGRRMSQGLSSLATVGSVSPFIGLFGTVWGIMNSFIGIAKTQTTNLSVVAPGIAEALFATAIGLVAAIPAVVLYNYFTKYITSYKADLADITAQVMLIIGRMLDNKSS